MDGEHFTSGPAFFHGGGPEKARQRLPKLSVQIVFRFEPSQKMAFARSSQRQYSFTLQGLALRFALVDDDGQEIRESAAGECSLTSARAGQKDQAAGLLLDQASNQVGIGFRKFPLTNANVAEEDDVVARDCLSCARKRSQVISTATRLHARMEQN